MSSFGEMVRWQTRVGEPMRVGDTTVTPESSALVVRLPGRRSGAFVWNRPVAVVVQRGEESERIPIVDVTRLAQVGLWAGTLALALILVILSVRRKEQGE